MNDNFLVVISHYSARGDYHLKKLLSEISPVTKNLLVVINCDLISSEREEFFESYRALIRPNLGMNIGAWNAAFHRYPNYEYYLFLQDECSLIRQDFLEGYKKQLDIQNIGMVGESVNFKWARPWDDIYMSPLNYASDTMLKSRRISRVENYLNLMMEWGINPGSTGMHLRSLVWAFKGSTLKKLRSFPVGLDKEQCIAAEIAVSKKVESLGLGVTQISPTPFYFFKHEEWLSNGVSKK